MTYAVIIISLVVIMNLVLSIMALRRTNRVLSTMPYAIAEAFHLQDDRIQKRIQRQDNGVERQLPTGTIIAGVPIKRPN